MGVGYHCQIQPNACLEKPDTSRVIDAIQTFGGLVCATSAQHVDVHESSQSRDHVNSVTFLNWLNQHNPFE